MTATDPGALAPVDQHGTHHKLVSLTEQWKLYPKLTLDAIIVPAARPAWHLEQAITLARAAHCPLLILCSHQATPADVGDILSSRSFDQAIVVDLPDGYSHELLDFRGLASFQNYLPEACGYYTTDLSTKRNLGLLLARMAGWERIFFLDDDIRDIGHPDLQSTVSMLARYRTAGMRVTDFPDNSAACHAYRATGGNQDVFLSGAALAVDMRQEVGFFANIYNEDWLFMYDDVANGRIGSSARWITQLRYNPFADPRRAAWQEFGDTLAEGLYGLLDGGRGLHAATREYWREFLRARRKFLTAIIRGAGALNKNTRSQLVGSVQAALDCSRTIEPRMLERYITLWRQDRDEWLQRMPAVGRTLPIDVALKELGLEASHHGRARDVTQLPRERPSQRPPATPDARDRGAGNALSARLYDCAAASVWQGGVVAGPAVRKVERAYGRQVRGSAPEARV